MEEEYKQEKKVLAIQEQKFWNRNKDLDNSLKTVKKTTITLATSFLTYINFWRLRKYIIYFKKQRLEEEEKELRRNV